MAKRLNKVEESFLNTIKNDKLIEKGDKLVVGVSGGSDSITLLYLLNKYKAKFDIELVVCHINHLIREDSTDDEQYVENLCEKMEIDFFKTRVDVKRLAEKFKMGEEEAGRKVRYEFFDEIKHKVNANKIAIAHNMNDNAETMILNIIRGSGLLGLEGITSRDGEIIRPLINCKKTDINEFCKENNIEYKVDSTNKENIYRRNIIRNELLPKFEEINPNIVEALSRTSKIVKENNNFIEKITENEYKKIANEEEGQIIIDLKEFNKLEQNIKENVTFKAIERLQKNKRNIEKANIDEIIKMASNNIGGKYTIINKNIKAEITKGKLIICTKV